MVLSPALRRPRLAAVLLVAVLGVLPACAGADDAAQPGEGGTARSTLLGSGSEAASQALEGAVGVAQALAVPDGASLRVRGHLVGQPTAPGTVVRGSFPDDLALAVADDPQERDPSRMLLVQLPEELRGTWGLASHPALLGAEVVLDGERAAYFSAPGLKRVTAVALVDPAAPIGPGAPAPTGVPADPPADLPAELVGYYADAEGRTGEDLARALHEIISTDVDRLRYDELWEALRDTDADPGAPGRVIELYTGDSVPGGANGGDPDEWNREHVWPQSRGGFGTSAGPGTDLHHVRPADVSVNADRSSLDFDDGGSPQGEADDTYRDADSWEPRDAVKGDVARMVLYMAVRYEGGDGYADLEVSEEVGRRDLDALGYLGRLSTLLRWHEQDPPDAFERARNDAIHETWQGNRNPFVDRPEWVSAIW